MVPIVADPAASVDLGARQPLRVPPNIFDLVASPASGNYPILPGVDEWWVTQLVWSMYYIAGTLVHTSISLVTVIELVAWMIVSFTTTAMSKLLAFSLCMRYEERSGITERNAD